MGAGFSFGGIDIASAQLDLIDIDAGPVLKVGQDFEFVPESVDVIYTFDDQVQIDGQLTTTYTAPVGQDVEFQYSVDRDLGISTEYVLHNSFRNTTQMLIAASYDLKMLSAEVNTFVHSLLGADPTQLALSDPPPTQIGEAAPLGNPIFNETFSLDFERVAGIVIGYRLDQ